jgi:hypothetical protein
MKFKLSNILRSLFIPTFNEVSLFSMSLTCLLLIITNFKFHIVFTSNPPANGHYEVLIVYAVFAGGLLLSIFHAFSTREKSSLEKIFMLFFACFICGFVGIWSGTYLWYRTESWYRIFPVWNVISSYFLLCSVRDSTAIDDRILDTDASPLEIGLSTVLTLVVFSVSQYLFKLYWAATFSITVAYATNINAPVLNLILGPDKNKKELNASVGPSQ